MEKVSNDNFEIKIKTDIQPTYESKNRFSPYIFFWKKLKQNIYKYSMYYETL